MMPDMFKQQQADCHMSFKFICFGFAVALF